MPSTTPALFIGHGSPMLAVEDNPFVPAWAQAVRGVRPKGIVCISAHWVDNETEVSGSLKPQTLYDFYGFPPALYDLPYPAPGSAELVEKLQNLLGDTLKTNPQRGLDHGAWMVLRALYPQADVPVVQLSLNARLSPQEHFELGKQLRPLRQEGYLILGSGNLVHNLRLVDWRRINGNFAFDWAQQAQTLFWHWIEAHDIDALTRPQDWPQALQLAVPTAEHFLPLLYVLAVANSEDEQLIFNRQCVGGALDMSCLKLQAA